jgi:hypothetical protein
MMCIFFQVNNSGLIFIHLVLPLSGTDKIFFKTAISPMSNYELGGES